MRIWILALAALVCATPAVAAEVIVTGYARVVDGDTLEVRGERIRIEGIDAPERWQRCLNEAGYGYRCGQHATEFMRNKIRFGRVTCVARQGRDRYGRLIATCFNADGTNLNALMVEHGHALAYRRYSQRYVAEERRARNGRRGMHAVRFVPPWDWRRGKRLGGRK